MPDDLDSGLFANAEVSQYGYAGDPTGDTLSGNRPGAYTGHGVGGWENPLGPQSRALGYKIRNQLQPQRGQLVEAIDVDTGEVLDRGRYDDNVPNQYNGRDLGDRYDIYDREKQSKIIGRKVRVRLASDQNPAYDPDSILGKIRAHTQYDQFSDDDILERYRQKAFPTVDRDRFMALSKRSNGRQQLEDDADKGLSPLKRIRKNFPQYGEVSDDSLVHRLYQNGVGVKKGEGYDAYNDRINPSYTPWWYMKRWASELVGGAASGEGAGGWQANAFAKMEEFPKQAQDVQKWLESQPWYAYVNPAEYWAGQARGNADPGGFRARAQTLYNDAQKKRAAAAEAAAANPAPDTTAGKIGAGLAQGVTSLPDAAVSFGLTAVNPAASVVWGMIYEGVSAQGQAQDAKEKHSLEQGILASGSRAVAQYLLNSPTGRIAGGALQAALGMGESQASAFLSGKDNPIDKQTATATVDFLIGVMASRKKELTEGQKDALTRAHDAKEMGRLEDAQRAVDEALSIGDDHFKQGVAHQIEDAVQEQARARTTPQTAHQMGAGEVKTDVTGKQAALPPPSESHFLPSEGGHFSVDERGQATPQPRGGTVDIQPDDATSRQKTRFAGLSEDELRKKYEDSEGPIAAAEKAKDFKKAHRLRDDAREMQLEIVQRAKRQGQVWTAQSGEAPEPPAKPETPAPEEPKPEEKAPEPQVLETRGDLPQENPLLPPKDFKAEKPETPAPAPAPEEKPKPADAYRAKVEKSYKDLATEKRNPNVSVHELHERVGGKVERLHKELRSIAKERRLSPSEGEPTMLSPEEKAAGLKLEGEDATFNHVKIHPEIEKETPGIMFATGFADLGRALKGVSHIADLMKPVREGAEKLYRSVPGLADYGDMLHAELNPEALGPEAEKGGAVVAEAQSKRKLAQQNVINQVVRGLDIEDKINGIEKSQRREGFFKQFSDYEMIKMLNDVENGRSTGNRQADALFKIYRSMYDAVSRYDEGSNLHYDLRDEYVPHMFESKREYERYSNWYEKKFGNPNFSEGRHFDTIMDAYQHGFKMKTLNPERLMQMRWASSLRARTRVEILKGLKDSAVAFTKDADGFYPKGARDWKEWRAPDGTTYKVHPAVTALLDRLWDHSSIYNTVFGPWMRGAGVMKGITSTATLAWSVFHPMHIAQVRIADSLVNASKGFLGGKPRDHNLLAAFGRALGTSVSDYRDAHPIVKAWNGMEDMRSLSRSDQLAVKLITEGGGDLTHSEEREMEWAQWMGRQLHKIAGVRNIDPKRMAGIDHALSVGYHWVSSQFFQKWFFRDWIPSLKASAYLERANSILKLKPDLLNDAVSRKVELRKIWKDVDGRFGEMFYDNLFWNKLAKDVGVNSLLSLGWNLSFFRIYGGAFHDLAHNVAHMDEIAKTFREEGLRATADKFLTQKVLFATYYTAMAAVSNGLMTWAFTGSMPNGQDYAFPRIGKNPDGTDKRLNTQFFLREFFAWHNHVREKGGYATPKGWVVGTGEMVKNKLQPMISNTIATIENVNYRGQQIYSEDPGSNSFVTTLTNWLQYALPTSFTPISVQGFNDPNKTPGDKILSFMGFNPSAAWTSRSAVENDVMLAYHQEHGHAIPKEEADKTNARQEYRQAVWSKDPNKVEAAERKLSGLGETGRQISNAAKAAEIPVAHRIFGRISTARQVQLLRRMSPDEVDTYWPYATHKAKAQYQDAIAGKRPGS
jgi:hypothetical protein